MELTTEALREIMPFGAHMDMHLVSASPDEVVGGMDWSESTTTMGEAMHDGAFLRGVREGAVTATGRLVRKGRTTIVAETELTDDRDARLLVRRRHSRC